MKIREVLQIKYIERRKERLSPKEKVSSQIQFYVKIAMVELLGIAKV
jgi:hypothetical protein